MNNANNNNKIIGKGYNLKNTDANKKIYLEINLPESFYDISNMLCILEYNGDYNEYVTSLIKNSCMMVETDKVNNEDNKKFLKYIEYVLEDGD